MRGCGLVYRGRSVEAIYIGTVAIEDFLRLEGCCKDVERMKLSALAQSRFAADTEKTCFMSIYSCIDRLKPNLFQTFYTLWVEYSPAGRRADVAIREHSKGVLHDLPILLRLVTLYFQI